MGAFVLRDAWKAPPRLAGWGASCAENISAASFNMNVAGIQQIIDTVRPQHAKLTVEMTAWTFPYNMQTYLDLLSAVDRPEFAVHLDPVNILDSPGGVLSQYRDIARLFSTTWPTYYQLPR